MKRSIARSKKGFTLIELLVVIAIIGMLSSIVLASLKSARAKASDAKILSQFAGLRTQAMLYSGAGGTYDTRIRTQNPGGIGYRCPGPNDMSLLSPGTGAVFIDSGDPAANSMFALIKDLPTVSCFASAGLPSDGAIWEISAKLSTGGFVCADWTGAVKTTDANGNAYIPANWYSAGDTVMAFGSKCL